MDHYRVYFKINILPPIDLNLYTNHLNMHLLVESFFFFKTFTKNNIYFII